VVILKQDRNYVIHLLSASRTDGPPLRRRDGPRVSYVFFIADILHFILVKQVRQNEGSELQKNCKMQ
jgi:hypothetical protein